MPSLKKTASYRTSALPASLGLQEFATTNSLMSRVQIEQAIAALSSEERRDLIRTLLPRKLTLSAYEADQIRQAALAVADGSWIDWDTLKNDLPIPDSV
jgi:hypothetical protein